MQNRFSGSFKAQVLRKVALVEEKPLRLEELPFPILEGDEILIQVHACGVCLTDRQIIEGGVPLSQFPIVLGHQVVGSVVKKGAHVQKFEVGDQVGIPWLSSTCQKCSFCLKGRENLCYDAKFNGRNVNGGYAEFMKAKEAYAVRLRGGVDPVAIAPLLCAGVVGYRSYKLSNIQPGEHLGIFGFGSAGHLVIQIALYHGCKVSVFTRSEKHRAEAKRLGAFFVGVVGERPSQDLDSAIIFAPNGSLVPPALACLKRGGTLAFNAIHASNIPEFPYSLIYHEKTLTTIANATREDATEFFDLANQAGIKADVKTYPLARANEAHLDLKEGRISSSVVLIP